MHVITGLGVGGAESMLLRLLKGLNRNQFLQSVVSLTTEGEYRRVASEAGISVVALNMRSFRSLTVGLARLSTLMRKQRPHIVQTWLYHADLIGLLAARMSGIARVAWNVRCASLEPGDAPWSTRVLVRVLAKLSRHPDAVVFNSRAGLDAHNARGYRPRRSLVIPNGFDLAEWRPDAARRAALRAELGVGDETILIGMVARYHPMKDHATFLSTAQRLRAVAQNFRFVLAGSGITWDNTALVAVIDRMGLRDCVSLLGQRSDVQTLMAGLDCLVSTSTSEGFPNVIGEALACGVPCVATDAGDSRLIIGESGTVAAVGDAAGLAAGVGALFLASRSQRVGRAQLCRARVSGDFELSHVIGRYADLYRELNEHGRG